MVIGKLAILATALICAAAIFVGCTTKNTPVEPFVATDITGADFARNFRLKDHNGTLRSLDDFKGKAVLVFFGYTHCPDVCLTMLSGLAMVQKRLGSDAARVQVLFVTLDPARDTPEKLASYVTYFDKNFLALLGDEATIASTAKEFKVSYAKHETGSAAGYLIDHSAGAYGYDPQGRLRILVNYDAELGSIVHDVKLLLGEKP